MRSILLKGLDRSYKSNIFIHKEIKNKIYYNSNSTNKKPIRMKLLYPRKGSAIKNILYPLSLHYKKIIENSNNNKKPYCITEAYIETETKNNNNNYRKLILLPKIQDNNKYLSKKDIYLGLNKYSLNLNSGSALSCGKISFDKNIRIKEKNETENKNVVHPFVKKLVLKEIVFNKNKSEKRERNIVHLVKFKKRLNYKKKEENNNMNDIIISNDFHGSKLINFYDNWKERFQKLNMYAKYQQKKSLNKRSGNNNELEKNQSIDTTILNKRRHFSSFQNISKINSSRKISRTINNTENKNNISNTINVPNYIQKRKIKYKNDDIINYLSESNN